MPTTGLRSSTLTCECLWLRGLQGRRAQVTRCRDNSGTITYDEFKNVFKATLAEDSIPFDFDGYASPH